MMSSSSNTTKWMSYLEEGLLAEEEVQPTNPFFWCSSQHPVEQVDCSIDNECSKGGPDVPERSFSRKRSREEISGGAGNKACREKMRRDRLNDRFLELGAILEPGRPPKTDKATILSDAVRILTQLRAEAQGLTESNNQLRETIKDLKNEKNELREEKSRLKADKERLELQVKAMTIPTRYMPHPAAIHAAAAAFSAQAQAVSTKAAQMAGYSGMAMWQWMSPAAVDTSQDHVLRPPVA
ncbi:transcription factor bHLH115 [Physcomitrium patens]|uniref:BHLH domain-containing protein n=1 Tax=Physcomitrium patens TaxID=3218 RepID=A0A2K1KLF8_PHYPA|nr:transcription factor ILR3-like [Physcomitrium patens]XP_024376915.1 transcription factor ILR3-like [Physcomitrium patens]PNR54609.1 hypothetical protein PHYPA_008286 [Physcomitrium patens]|eukprot:XP_024376913.1 transcription factor ILR3-like [Physcomitrella patens]